MNLSENKAGFYWHVHHDILMGWCFDYYKRVNFIKKNKPGNEQEIRLKLFKPVKGKLPNKLLKAGVAYSKARTAYDEAIAAYDEAWIAYSKAVAAYYKPFFEYDEAWAAYDEAGVAYSKAMAADNETRAAYNEARAAYDEAWAANYKQIEDLHKKECPNCTWDGKTIFPRKQMFYTPGGACF